MAKDFRATALERAVGRQLARWRNERTMSLIEAGQRVGFSSAKLSMMENAVQPSAVLDVMALGFAYRVPTPEWQAAVSRVQHAEQLRARGQSDGLSFDPVDDFADLVFEATVLRAFTTDLVPAVFQLPGYTDAVMQDEDPMRAVRIATVREAWLERVGGKDPLSVEVVFPEAVLRQVIAGPRGMKAQLLYLLEVGEHPAVSMRVVPRGAGAYPAMGSPFTLLEFPHRQHNDVAYLENFIKAEYVEKPSLTEQCTQRFTSLQKVALDDGDSRELIAEAAAEL